MNPQTILKILETHCGERGELIAILEEIQAKYSYLPEEAFGIVAEKTGRSLVDIYGVATFYKSFSFKSRGKHLVSVCLGTACHVRGGSSIAEAFERQLGIKAGETTPDKEITLETLNCLGACALGPHVVVDGHYFSNVTIQKVDDIIHRAKVGLGRVDFKQVRGICDRAGLLLIFDEVQVGMGRTGRLFAYEHYGIEPDIMTLAKGLGGGIPIGAMLGTDKIAPSFSPGTHASTFGGNPLSTAAGVATMHILLQPGFLETCAKRGRYFFDRLTALKKKHPVIAGVRGKGLILALELAREGADVVTRCMEQGVLINCTMDRVLRFIPPLTISEGESD